MCFLWPSRRRGQGTDAQLAVVNTHLHYLEVTSWSENEKSRTCLRVIDRQLSQNWNLVKSHQGHKLRYPLRSSESCTIPPAQQLCDAFHALPSLPSLLLSCLQMFCFRPSLVGSPWEFDDVLLILVSPCSMRSKISLENLLVFPIAHSRPSIMSSGGDSLQTPTDSKEVCKDDYRSRWLESGAWSNNVKVPVITKMGWTAAIPGVMDIKIWILNNEVLNSCQQEVHGSRWFEPLADPEELG